jgi:hypothetical protein
VAVLPQHGQVAQLRARDAREAKQVTGNDRKVDEIKGTKKSGIDGDNHTNHRQRVQRVP